MIMRTNNIRFDACFEYLTGAPFVIRTVILVDDDGVIDILHHDVLENNLSDEPVAGPPPCLDPEPISRPPEHSPFHCHILHSLLLRLLRQAPNAALK